MGVFANIRNALNTRLSTLTSVPTIQWQNVESIPALANVYLRPTLLPANAGNYVLTGSQRHSGIYQVDVFVKVGKGTKLIDQWCDAIANHFLLQVLENNSNSIHIMNVSIGSIDIEESWARGFVEIAYECYN